MDPLSPSLETYLETIYLVRSDDGTAHTTDIAEHLGVRKPSVTGALHSLAERELITYQPYRPITMTLRGRRLAENIHCRHQVLRDFLKKILGIPPEIAEHNARTLEHHISPLVQARLAAYINFVDSCVEQRFTWKDQTGIECRGDNCECEDCIYTACDSSTKSM